MSTYEVYSALTASIGIVAALGIFLYLMLPSDEELEMQGGYWARFIRSVSRARNIDRHITQPHLVRRNKGML